MAWLSDFLSGASGWLLPVPALWLLLRCLRSMLQARYEPELWAYLEFPDGSTAKLRHWECIAGAAPGSDIVLPKGLADRTHAAIIRSDRGVWQVFDLGKRGGTFVNDAADQGGGLWLRPGDTLRFGQVTAVFHPLGDEDRIRRGDRRSMPGALVDQGGTLLLLTLFQVLLTLELLGTVASEFLLTTSLAFAALILTEWGMYFLMRAMDRRGYEIETLAFFLCTLGMEITVTAAPEDLGKHLLLLLGGIVLFLLLGWWLRNLQRSKVMRWPVAGLALGFLALNLAAGYTANGAANWLAFGGFSLQPSEFVKVAFVYVGAASLDRLYRGRNLFLFIAFSALCVGALALMGDFGTALVFFVTFLVISFLRSGSFATVFLAVAGAGLAGFLVLTVKPYIAQRFAIWGHVWDEPYGAGWQQTRSLTAAADGGLFGVGAGKGWLRGIFAADTDMVFCLLCEELGLIIALCAMLALLTMALFAVRSAAKGRSTFFVIAACATAAMLLTQLALNVFGSTDILPFTGVTFPFVSRGGSSLISCWMMLAYLKAADTRQNASFSVRLFSERKRKQEGGEVT